MDAGGGVGVLAESVLRRHAGVNVTLLERPEVLRLVSVPRELGQRLELCPADLFEPWGVRGDAVLLARVIHDWGDAAAGRILRNARDALPAGGRVFLVEMVLPQEAMAGGLCDLHLLMAAGGQERTEAQYGALLERAGFDLLEVRDLHVAGRGRDAVDGLTLAVRPGEVLGIAGVQGNGQSELLECIAGLATARSGSVWLKGANVTALPPRQRMAAGLAHIPEDRHQRGLVLDFSLIENLVLGRHRSWRRWYGLDRDGIAEHASQLIERFDVRPPIPETAAWTLSGGNQQKVVVAREMHGGPAVLLAGQPTRGVDVGAIEQIHGRIREARDAGLGVLLVSADLAEVLALSDRVAVMYEGRVVAEMPAAEATVGRLGELMMGVES